jgi:acyl-CoA synthetase (AMP-forming)/AMP-acid ligase II
MTSSPKTFPLHLQQLVELLLYPHTTSTITTNNNNNKNDNNKNHESYDVDIEYFLRRPALKWKRRIPSSSRTTMIDCFCDKQMEQIMTYWKSPHDEDSSNNNNKKKKENHDGITSKNHSNNNNDDDDDMDPYCGWGDSRWSSLDTNNNNNDEEEQDNVLSSTSTIIRHKDLLYWIRLLMYQLLSKCRVLLLEDDVDDDDMNSNHHCRRVLPKQQPQHQQPQPQPQQQQPIVAVAIPEGPYLAISILSIFVLNLCGGGGGGGGDGNTKEASAAAYCPIILPLDPEEGNDRLLYMFKDAQPSIVLYATNEDYEKLKKCCGCVNNNDHGSSTSSTSRTRFYNVRHLLQEHVSMDQQLSTIRSFCNTLLDTTLASWTVSPPSSSSSSTITKQSQSQSNHPSHIVYTSGTTGNPKGCTSSISALVHYIQVKNQSHHVSYTSNVFLASALPFDPCLSDIIATWSAFATLSMPCREDMKSGEDLGRLLRELDVTHVLCTPSLWSGVHGVVGEEEGKERRDGEGAAGGGAGGRGGVLGKLEVVALGGECISRRVRQWWGRRKMMKKRNMMEEEMEGVVGGFDEGGKLRLLSTYGVTEACVYQTIGEVFADDEESDEEEEHGMGLVLEKKGHDIGLPMDGMEVLVWRESKEEEDGNVVDWESSCSELVVPHGTAGELVLKGRQLDEFSGYLNMPEASRQKFLLINGEVYYRTGDRGYIHPRSGHLYILGRIGGEEGMVKINGIRVELGEIEHSIMDPVDVSSEVVAPPVVIGCIVTVLVVDDEGHKKLIAYCVLSDQCLQEIGVTSFPHNGGGIICSSGPLLTLLRARCKEKVRKGCVPSNFVLIKRIPLTRTGKINRGALPAIETCLTLDEAVSRGGKPQVHLSDYGRCGNFVANELATCLNLHESQRRMITTTANFAMLGGDSLAATRIVRALYASHHGLQNARSLGGAFGIFDGVFNASNLIRSNSLGEYIDLLDSSGVLSSVPAEQFHSKDISSRTITKTEENHLYDALIQAITMNQSTIAVSLLLHGANPNLEEHGQRLGNTSGRLEQRDTFHSNPLHLACVKGDLRVVRALLMVGHCNCKSPDSSGTYPIHLACSGLGDGIAMDSSTEYNEHEDRQRLECVKLLLDLGKVPLPMKNSSKQSVLHCAARGGYCILLDYLLTRWNADESIKAVKQWGAKCDWQDR